MKKNILKIALLFVLIFLEINSFGQSADTTGKNKNSANSGNANAATVGATGNNNSSGNTGNTNAIGNLIKSLEDTGANYNIISIGFSFASRTIWKQSQSSYQTPSISPVDSTLKLEKTDPHDFVLSTSVVISPFVNNAKINGQIASLKDKNYLSFERLFYYLIKNASFTVNVNLIDFASAQSSYSFNKSLEGGIGVALRIAPKIFIGYSNEIVQSQQLTDDLKSRVGQKIYNNGQVVTSLSQIDASNSNFWVTKNLIAQYWRIIISLK